MNPYDLIKIEGYWWPADVGEQYIYSLRRVQSMQHSIAWCAAKKRLGVVVQAGGSIGVWPRTLAKHFQWVYTFEPEPISFHCLCRNITEENVFKLQAALGNDLGGLAIKKVKLTSHQIIGDGPILQIRIDALTLRSCDAILLDVEGYELKALLGAGITISRFHPLVLVEARGKYSRDQEAIAMFLLNAGYQKPICVGMDDIYVF